MRRNILLSLLLFAFFGGIFYITYAGQRKAPVKVSEPPKLARDARLEQAKLELAQRVPVPNNRTAEIPDGYRGEVHPLLTHHSEMEVNADWKPAKVDRSELLSKRTYQPELDVVRDLLLEVGPAIPAKIYSERDFSRFLPPESIKAAGRIWALDSEKVVEFLKQFHPAVSAYSVSVGRRPGPDGAFAMLRGVSSSYLDIEFRVHAEFNLAPKTGEFPALYVWYTPSYLQGRIVVNRDTGTVEYFQCGVPTDEVLNIHTTVWVGQNDPPNDFDAVYQHLRADRMELVGGSLRGLEGVQWTDQISTSQARDKLARVFYKFKEVDYVPFDQALAIARTHNKPIFAFVALGALDDQSC